MPVQTYTQAGQLTRWGLRCGSVQMQLVSERWGSLQHLTATLTEGRAAPGEQSAALMLEAGPAQALSSMQAS